MSLLSDFAAEGSLDLVAQGRLTPEETKAKLISTLAPYFTNVSTLEKLAVVLAPEAVNLRAIERDKTSQQLFSKVSGDYQKAEAVDSAACYEACRDWEQKIQDGLAEYWSALRLNVDLGTLSINDFKFETFRIIGLLIEAVMQPALRELLFQTRLGAGQRVTQDDVNRADLGIVIEELARTFSYAQFLAPAPWNVMLNQWRNMAHHFSTRVEGARIVGVYGKGKNKSTLHLSREELFNAAKTIHSLSRALKTARTIFIVNRIDKIGLHTNAIELRDDVKLLYLESAFAVQGFELLRIEVTPVAVDATVRDVTELPRKTRMIHSSQFVYPIWCEFPCPTIKVNYWDKNGVLLVTSTVRGVECKMVADGDVAFGKLASMVRFDITAAGRAVLE